MIKNAERRETEKAQDVVVPGGLNLKSESTELLQIKNKKISENKLNTDRDIYKQRMVSKDGQGQAVEQVGASSSRGVQIPAKDQIDTHILSVPLGTKKIRSRRSHQGQDSNSSVLTPMFKDRHGENRHFENEVSPSGQS